MTGARTAGLLARFFGAGLVVLLCIWLAAISVVAWLAFKARVVARDAGERSTAAMAAMVEQQTARTFQAINLTLGAVGDAHQLRPRPRPNDAEFQRMMSRRLSEIPFVRALFVVGPDGWIIHDTDYPSTPRVSLADRPYFGAHLHDKHLAGAIWPPLKSRSGTGWFVPVTRQLGRGDEFEGVVVAAIQADYFEAQFRRIGLEASYLVALFDRDGTLIARYPGGGDIAKNFGDLPIFAHLLSAPQDTFWTGKSLVPGQRVVSYRTVEGTPLVLHVSQDENEILAGWRRAATGAGVGMLALTVFLAWYLVQLLRAQARRRRERDKRAQGEKLEALGQLTAEMAHDFGNMLQVVAVNADILRQCTPPGAVSAQALGAIERAVNDATGIMRRLLSFARRRPLAVTRIRLDEWLEDARLLLAQAAGPLVTIQTEIKRPLPQVLCDTAHLDVALVNLVVNARDAMAGSGTISVRAYPCDNHSGAKRFAGSPAPFVCLAVQDSGCGMSEQVRRRALEPFYSTKGEAGTGLGLSQVYGFMQQVGGDLTIESAPGQGTTVHLFFPVAGPQ